MKRFLSCAALLLALPVVADAQVARPARIAQQAVQGMVSASDPRAAAAGVEMLRAGGSATDAAIATLLALNVVEPQNSGVGGGGFWVGHDARTGKLLTIDGREAAPAAADPHWFYAPDGNPLSHSAAVPGGRSVGVPGNLREWAMAHARAGKLPWAKLFEPAIRLARDGFRITQRLNTGIDRFGSHIDPWARAKYRTPDGEALPVGTLIKNPEQAALFERLARLGPDSFYVGPDAQKLVTAVNTSARNPSKMTAGDLASYDAKERAPVCGSYRAYRICGMGPPSSGGVAVLMILKQLERFDMAKLGKDSPVAWHLIAESQRLAYADRDMYLADPDHETVPVEGLLDPKYIAARSALISPDRTMASATPGMPAGAPARIRVQQSEVPGTTHVSATDARGNAVSVTSTIEGYFGSGLSVNGTMLNNELTDFDIVPEKNGHLVANRVEGGKRPRSSMSPTIVYGPDGKVRLVIGAAGGSTIIAQVAKAVIAVIDWRMTAQDAIGLGLIYAPGQIATLEQGTQLDAMAPALKALGEPVRIAPLGLKANAVERLRGRWVGGADPRSEGVAMRQDGTVVDIKRVGGFGTRPPE